MSYPGSEWAQNAKRSILIKEEKARRHKGGGHVTTEAEIGVMPPQAKEHQGSCPPEARRHLWNGFPLRAREGSNPADAMILDF